MAELLLELFSEEIPARMQGGAEKELETKLTAALKEAGLTFSKTATFSTPRRLTFIADGLPISQPDIFEERKGPRVDAPEKAIEGFLRSVDMTLDQVKRQETKKGDIYVAVIERKGGRTIDVLGEIIPEVIKGFHWPKSMRYGPDGFRWVRPLQSVLCVFDGTVVPFEIGGLKSGKTTYGHRFLAPSAIDVKSSAQYKEKLCGAHVVLDAATRREQILDAAKALTEAKGLDLVDDPGLLNEVAGLVEWPVVLMGGFDEDFLHVPDEVLTSAMRGHQKYFSVRDPKTGRLAPNFVVVSNLVATDGGEKIVHGNERVLRARLSDARFFWDQDRKNRLDTRLADLKDIVFHAKLGTVSDKVDRVEQLAGNLADAVKADPKRARRAARLAKADLVTGMVYEFPELQGIMGRYYAVQDGEDEAVANAIRDHYAPQGPGDFCPSEPVSMAVALADKLDTLVGFWAIDEKPTGSKDPFALRRAALGAIRIILENDVRLNLLEAFKHAANAGIADKAAFTGETAQSLLAFFADRMKVYLRDKGARHDLIDAVFAMDGQDDLVLIVRRVEALAAFLASDDGTNLLAGYKRAANILKIEEKKDKTSYEGRADAGLFDKDEERVLFERIESETGAAKAAIKAESFETAMASLAALRRPVDAFFESVTVNADDQKIRQNRLRLLSQIRTSLEGVADFSRIEG